MPDDALPHNGHHPDPASDDAVASAGMTVQQDDDYLPIQEAALRAGVSRAFVLSWIRNGFIEARTSQQGWLVRAGDIDIARKGAEDARAGYPGSPDQREEQPDDQDMLVAGQRHLPASIIPRNGSEALLAPFAEFIRDQADIVQEQAETIGWLQAELRRLRAQAGEHEVPQPAREPQHSDQAMNATAEPLEDVPVSPLDIIAADPFSEEAAQARIMIEETERKITGLWDEQTQRRSRHIQSRQPRDPDDTWIRRIVTSWKKQDAI